MEGSPHQVDSVIVVGSRSAGTLTSLLLRHYNPEIDIQVIDDLDKPVPDIARGSIENLVELLHGLLEIPEDAFIRAVNPVWKCGADFRSWCGNPQFYVQFDDDSRFPVTEMSRDQFDEFYHRYQNQEFTSHNTECIEQQKTPISANGSRFHPVAYHFSLARYVDFLRDVCRDRGVTFVNDTLTEVETDGEYIESVTGQNDMYQADLYLDATGFTRFLIRELSVEFEPYDDPLDSVVSTQTDITPSDVVPATVVRSGDAGWFWQIDTMDYRDWGYVYSSSHTSREAAIEELQDVVGEEIPGDRLDGYSFTSGVLNRAWVGNCVAIGNALGFIEPLQGTSIAANGALTRALAELLTEHGRINHQGIRELYNRYYDLQWERIYQFVVCHYKYADGETEFWQDTSGIDLWGPVDQHEQYQLNGFTNHGLYSDRLEPDTPFSTWYFARLLRGLGVRSSFYDDLGLELRPEVVEAVEEDREELAELVSEYKSYDEVYSSGESGMTME
jgi:tryptophan halogenase